MVKPNSNPAPMVTEPQLFPPSTEKPMMSKGIDPLAGVVAKERVDRLADDDSQKKLAKLQREVRTFLSNGAGAIQVLPPNLGWPGLVRPEQTAESQAAATGDPINIALGTPWYVPNYHGFVCLLKPMRKTEASTMDYQGKAIQLAGRTEYAQAALPVSRYYRDIKVVVDTKDGEFNPQEKADNEWKRLQLAKEGIKYACLDHTTSLGSLHDQLNRKREPVAA